MASDFWDAVRDPERASYEALVREARAALDAGSPTHAHALARAAIQRNPSLPTAYVVDGRALLAAGDMSAASQAFAAAYRSHPGALDADDTARAAAHAALRAGSFGLSAVISQRIASSLPPGAERARAYGRLGDALMCLGPARLTDALRAYRTALSDARFVDVSLRLGGALALVRAGRPGEARGVLAHVRSVRALEQALSHLGLPETEYLARLSLGLYALGNREDAALAWRSAHRARGPWKAHAPTASEQTVSAVFSDAVRAKPQEDALRDQPRVSLPRPIPRPWHHP